MTRTDRVHVLSDEEVMIALCRASDEPSVEELFGEVFRRYERRVQAWCFRFTGDRNRSTDLSQEVFFKAFSHKHSYRGDARLSTWLYAITRNHCMNSLKKRPMQTIEISDGCTRELRTGGGTEVYRAIDDMDALRKVWRIVAATLTPLEVRVITMHYAYDFPLPAITRELHLSNPSGAKAYIVNARRKLDKALHRGRTSECTAAAPLAG